MTVICKASAYAHANIALAKYWGKSDVALNLPAVPSISLTLEALRTDTTLVFDKTLTHDELQINATQAKEADQKRVSAFLTFLRERYQQKCFARVQTRNNFPTAAGLASSASGFAALVIAFDQAFNLGLSKSELSALARRGSASAARSIFGGFAKLDAGIAGHDALGAQPLFDAQHWDLRVVVAITTEQAKPLGSTAAMTLAKETSFYYDAWVKHAPSLCQTIEQALGERSLTKLGPALEASAMSMHACMLASRPAIIYWNAATLSVLSALKHARETTNLAAYATMDAGPQVKVFCLPADASRVEALLMTCEGVQRTLTSKAGPGAQVTEAT